MKQKLLSLLTLLLCVYATAWADEVTASWLAPSNSMALTGSSSSPNSLTANDATYTTSTLSYVESWSRNNTYYYVLYNASGQSLDNSGEINTNKYIDFTVTVPAGTTFTPSKIQLVAIGRSTGGNAYRVDYIDNSGSSTIQSVTKPGSGTESAVDYSFQSPSSYSAGTTLTIRVYLGINNSNSGRGVGLRDVKLIGNTVSLSGPTITTQPSSATYEAGDDASALTVAATASAGNLSYQWYSNTDGDTTGKDDDKIAEANAATLPATSISTASEGTTYFYCIVTDGNGSTTSSKATIKVENIFVPTISYANNTATINYTGSGTVYYTTDNSDPSTSETKVAYSDPIALTNTSTVRAVAIKGENKSEIVFANCKVDHSATALAVIGFGDGTYAEGTWTSSDGNFVLKSSNSSEIQYYTIFNGQDGFKLNHSNSYTLKVSDNIKVTSIKFVGKSRGDAANDATIAFEGFTPENGGVIEKGTFVKTIEFTPATAKYGPSIEITTGGNQFGGYFEIYGEEYTKTSTITTYESTTWDFTNWSDATKNGVIADTENWNQYEKADNGGSNFGDNGRSIAISRGNNSLSYKASEESSPKIAETDGLKFTCDAFGLGLMFNQGSTSIGTYKGSQYIWLYSNKSKISIENVTKGSIIEIGVESHKDSEARTVSLNDTKQTQGATEGNAAMAYQVCKWEVTKAGTITITPSKGLHIYYIKLDKAIESEVVKFTPAYAKTTYVTTKALDFSDVEGLTAYVATEAGGGSVKLDKVGAVPAGTPLLLEGTAGTEYTVPVVASAEAPADNMFRAGDGETEFYGTTFDYILYSDGKFYQIGSGTVATTKAYLHCDSDPTGKTGARGLSIVYDDVELTGITNVSSGKANSGVYYNLNGQRIGKPAKGMYILDGKKYIAK